MEQLLPWTPTPPWPCKFERGFFLLRTDNQPYKSNLTPGRTGNTFYFLPTSPKSQLALKFQCRNPTAIVSSLSLLFATEKKVELGQWCWPRICGMTLGISFDMKFSNSIFPSLLHIYIYVVHNLQLLLDNWFLSSRD